MIARLMSAWGATALAALAQVHVVNMPVGGNVMLYYHVEAAGSSKEAARGAAYSAEIVMEHTQTLADGNTISQRETQAVYRDSEGRMRRDPPARPNGFM